AGGERRRLAPLPGAHRGGLGPRAASGRCVPRPPGGSRGRPARRGQGPQGVGGRHAAPAAWSAVAAEPGRGPPPPTAPGAGHGPLPEPSPVRAATADGGREESPGAAVSRVAAVAGPAGPHGRGLSAVRRSLRDGDSLGEAGPAAPARAPLSEVGPSPEQAVLAEPGEGVGILE